MRNEVLLTAIAASVFFTTPQVVNISTTVAAGKKGLRNTIKSLWRGKESRGESMRPDGAYGYSMPEAQLWLSADLAFMLRDYDLALQGLAAPGELASLRLAKPLNT